VTCAVSQCSFAGWHLASAQACSRLTGCHGLTTCHPLCRSGQAADPSTNAELSRLLRAAATGAVQQAQLAQLAPRAHVLRRRMATNGVLDGDLSQQYTARWSRILANIGLDAKQQVRAEQCRRIFLCSPHVLQHAASDANQSQQQRACRIHLGMQPIPALACLRKRRSLVGAVRRTSCLRHAPWRSSACALSMTSAATSARSRFR
jgi:hypothetical protein